MFRNKISLNTLFIYKPYIRNNNFSSSFNTKVLSSVHQNIIFRNLESTKFCNAFLFYQNFPKIKNYEKYMSQLSESICWNCEKPLKIINFTCSSCNALQPPKRDINFYELLGISQKYDINVEEMTKNFRKLQMIFHPDKVANKSEKEKLISEIYSRLLNKAYNTLKDPISRGFYLLEFYKVSSENSNLFDPKFLSSIMEKNEELETLDNVSSLNKFLEVNNEQVAKHHSAVQNAFLNNKLRDAKVNLLKLNYLLNLNQKIKEREMKIKSS